MTHAQQVISSGAVCVRHTAPLYCDVSDGALCQKAAWGISMVLVVLSVNMTQCFVDVLSGNEMQ